MVAAVGSSKLRWVFFCTIEMNMDKSIEEIENEITALQQQIEEIRFENSFRKETSGIEHTTPKSTLAMSNPVNEHDSGLKSGRPSKNADLSGTETCDREEYSGTKHSERTHVKLRGEASLRRGKCGGQYKRELVLPRQRASFSGDVVECLS
jgi:hypothetical protein